MIRKWIWLVVFQDKHRLSGVLPTELGVCAFTVVQVLSSCLLAAQLTCLDTLLLFKNFISGCECNNPRTDCSNPTKCCCCCLTDIPEELQSMTSLGDPLYVFPLYYVHGLLGGRRLEFNRMSGSIPKFSESGEISELWVRCCCILLSDSTLLPGI